MDERLADVPAITDEGDLDPAECREFLLDGKDVGQRLAWIVFVCQGIDHRDRRGPREGLELAVLGRAHRQSVDVERQRPSRVGDGFAPAELQLVRVEDDR